MSFFGLTQLGFQNYIRDYSTAAKADPYRGTRQLDYTALPPLKEKTPPARSVVPVDQVSGYGPGHEGSFAEYKRMHIKHICNPRPSNKNSKSAICGDDMLPKGLKSIVHKRNLRHRLTKHLAPQYFYVHPPTTSSEIGWWNKDSPLSVSRPWTHVPRKPYIYSEMTRFVNTMALTNREFKLF